MLEYFSEVLLSSWLVGGVVLRNEWVPAQRNREYWGWLIFVIYYSTCFRSQVNSAVPLRFQVAVHRSWYDWTDLKDYTSFFVVTISLSIKESKGLVGFPMNKGALGLC